MTENITSFVEGTIHEETQARGDEFDLTVNEVYEVIGKGRVDFGGGELEEAELIPHEKKKRNPDDDYKWWNLSSGQYLIEYNEELNNPDNRIFRVQTRDEVLARGAFHPTLDVRELGRVPLSVGGTGMRIKENARVSILRIR